MISLQKGTTLIEASAGTGKTYTLCRIALQLTLQKGITLDRILAVTFTEAATEELATRLHGLYQNCLLELENGMANEPLLKKVSEDPSFDPEKAKRALRYSLEIFDEAPISTIHGFCKRALELVALEAQTPLDAEISPVEEELVQQLQGEYIRQFVLEASTALSATLGNSESFAKRLQDVGRQTSQHPEAQLRPAPTPVDLASLERRFSELPAALADLIERKKDYLPHLRGRSKPHTLLSDESSRLHRAAQRGRLLATDRDFLAILDSSSWQSSLNKSGKDLPLPPAVALVDTVLEQVERATLYLVYNYRSWLAERLAAAKLQANLISFNDLLHLLQRAIRRDEQSRIVKLLSARYDAALIDEFQDTDRVQLQIAKTLFGNGEHYLFYIGDPKQAIYRFRGADIYAYFQATEASGTRSLHLESNFRSTPELVRAVNSIFSAARGGFVDERIRFQPVNAAREELSAPKPAFAIRQLALDPGATPYGKGDYRSTLAERAANDFARKLNADPTFDAASVTFLVNDRIEADALSESLERRGIACAVRADRSVFQTREADDLKQLLAALAAPARGSLKRGAYARLNRSVRASDLSQTAFDSEATPFFEFLSSWAREWTGSNFDVAFARLQSLGRDARAGGALPDAERRHSNFAQLAELLSEARDAEELSPRGLYNWLHRKSLADASQQEEWQTRISSDEGKPQILTVHKSKGLQFPVVVLPFVGLRRIRPPEFSTAYHGPDDEYVIDLAPEAGSPALERAQQESLAEDARLLYVALTRAVLQNVLYLSPEEISKRSGLPCSSFARFLLAEDEVSSEAVAQFLSGLAEQSDGCLDFEQIPYGPGDFAELERSSQQDRPPAAARQLERRSSLPGPERILSFSALSKGLRHQSGEPQAALTDTAGRDDDEAALVAPSVDGEEAPPEDETISIFTLPKGTRAGDLLHLILERFDFSRPDTLAATTREAFEALQFQPRAFEAIVAAQIGEIARAELVGRYGSFRLEQIGPAHRIAELEFSYPARGDVKAAILSVLQLHDSGSIPRSWIDGLASSPQSLPASMLRGFIDLVLEREGRFYLLDWKSNYLGPTPESYDQQAMLAAMADHNYFLQYLLYAVALKRFLAWRYPEQEFAERFGGVFYIFARGVTPGKSTGVYYDLPPAELLDALDHALNGH